MRIVDVKITPILVNREAVQEMLGGISRSTFYKKRKEWESNGTPFPTEVKELNPAKGGAIFRYDEVMRFCQRMGFTSPEQH